MPVTAGWQVRIAKFSIAAGGGLLLSLATVGSAAAPSSPPREYTLRVNFATDSYEDALLVVRNHILATLKSLHTFPPGYPKPCRFRFNTVQGPETIESVTPYGAALADPGAYGILLDAEAHYVMLDVIDYPDTRPHLFEIFLVGDADTPALDPTTRDTVPRIVVQYPALGGAPYPSLVEWLAESLRAAGAQVISLQ